MINFAKFYTAVSFVGDNDEEFKVRAVSEMSNWNLCFLGEFFSSVDCQIEIGTDFDTIMHLMLLVTLACI